MIFYEKDTSFEMTIHRIVFDECVNVDSSNRHFEGNVHDHFLFGIQKKRQKLSIFSKTLSFNFMNI